jgi:hypothetical protein
MINLVPQTAKKRLLVEYWMRTAVVWGVVWSMAVLVCILAFVPTYFLIGFQVVAYEDFALQAGENNADYKQVADELVQASEQARIIIEEARLPKISEYLLFVQTLQGIEVELTSVSVSRAETGLSPVVIQGVARDRRALKTFRDRLEADERVSRVELPLPNLAQDENLTFSLTVELSAPTESS